MLAPFSEAQLEIECRNKLGELCNAESVQVIVGPWHEGELANVTHLGTGAYKTVFMSNKMQGNLPLAIRADGQHICGSPFHLKVGTVLGDEIEEDEIEINVFAKLQRQQELKAEAEHAEIDRLAAEEAASREQLQAEDASRERQESQDRQYLLMERRLTLERRLSAAQAVDRRKLEMAASLKRAERCGSQRAPSVLGGMGLQRAVLNRTAEFQVKSLQHANGKKKLMILAFLTSPAGKKKGAEVSPIGNQPGEFTVKYTPRETGPHHLEVMIGNLEVEGSPFLINVHKPDEPDGEPGSSHACHCSHITPFWEALDTTEQAQTKQQCKPTIDPTVQPEAPKGEKQNPARLLQFSALKVVQKKESMRNKLTAIVGEATGFQLSGLPDDVAVEVSVQQPISGAIAGTVRRQSELVHDAEYVPKTVGLHVVEVTVAEQHVEGSPFMVEVTAGDVDPAKCDVHGDAVDAFAPFDEALEAGIETSLEVQVRDTHGNEVEGEVNVAVGKGQQQVQIMDHGDGKYLAVFRVPVSEGKAVPVHILVNKRHVGGSPFTMNVEPEAEADVRPGQADNQADPLASFVYGDAVDAFDPIDGFIEPGTSTTLTVQLRDKNFLIVTGE